MWFGDFYTKKKNQEEGLEDMNTLKVKNAETVIKLKEDLDSLLNAYECLYDLHRTMNLLETVTRTGNNTDDIVSTIKELEVKCQESRYALFVRGILK